MWYDRESGSQRKGANLGARQAGNQERLQHAMDVLEELLASERYQRFAAHQAEGRQAEGRQAGDQQPAGRVHLSATVYVDEPLVRTGRQMKGYLPERIRQMKAISRYEEGAPGKRGRWLSEEEHFWRQGTFMADFEDDCPYHGTFKAYYPTYDAMSDQQLRGYFTWRAQVRRGRIEETSPSFVFVYLYELICGIGVREPLEGFRIMEWVWQGCRPFAPELDRFVNIWLQDYAVYHGLPPELLAPYRTLAFDRALIALKRAGERAGATAGARRRRGAGPVSALPLPADEALEDELFNALDALSSYRLKNSRLYKAEPAGLRHVAGAVYVRTSAYYDKNRKAGVLESWFGEHMEQGYVMFGSAVFFEPARHADCVYELDELHRYRCTDGLWTCERYHGSRQRSAKLGQIMRATDRTLRAASGFPHPLKDDGRTPKYLQKIIDEEVAAWLGWQEAHRPVTIDIDLSQLAGIRRAASATREALLVDEEHEEPPASAGEPAPSAGEPVPPAGEPAPAAAGPRPVSLGTTDLIELEKVPHSTGGAEQPGLFDAVPVIELGTVPNSITGAGTADGDAAAAAGQAALSPAQAHYLRCLMEGASAGERLDAVAASGLSEDLLVDAVNEALFELVGDTVIEFGPEGPQLVEEYAEDVREVLGNGAD